jgi:septation ring formation regulator EzrA
MIVITIVIVVCIISMGIIQRNINKNRKRIKELEQRLNEYYNKRENRLLKKFKDIEQQ